MKEIGEPFKQMVGWDNPTILHYRRDDGTPGAFGGDNRFHTEKSIDELARSKHFTDAELSAEYWRFLAEGSMLAADGAAYFRKGDYDRMNQLASKSMESANRAVTVARFAFSPSYDD